MAKSPPQPPGNLTPARSKPDSATPVLSPPKSVASRIFNVLFGRPLANSEGAAQTVGPGRGVPILGLDALSSASYGPEAALAILIPAGALGLARLQGIMGAIICMIAILYFSYRQTIAAYPNGGVRCAKILDHEIRK